MLFLDESPFSMDLWLRTFGLSALTSISSMNGLNGNNHSNSNGEDILVPPYDADSRRGSKLNGKAVLMLTMVGNGCLGLPYVFAMCGVPMAILLIIALAIVTYRTLYLLIICARKTGANNFGDIIRVSFGYRAHWVCTMLVFVYLLMMLSMYMSLVRDIWTPLIQSHLPEASPFLVMFWLQIMLIPAFWQLSFQSLWFPVYIAIMGLIATFAILCFKANNYSIITDPGSSDDGRGLKTLPDTFTDTLSGLNVLLLNTVASFNILYIQSGLQVPSLSRMQRLTRQGVLFATLVAVAIGVAGYRFFGVAVSDSGDEHAYPVNFLDHHAFKQTHHHAISQALYFASGITIWLATPIILIPCRDNLLELIQTLILDGQCPDFSDCQDEIETWATLASTQSGQHHNGLVVLDESTQLLPSIEEDPQCDLNLNPYAHYGSILGIMVVAELFTLTNNVVPIIWKIVAPAMTVMIAYMIPTACYLEIHKRQNQEYKTFSRWVLILGMLVSFLCTVGAVNDVVKNW